MSKLNRCTVIVIATALSLCSFASSATTYSCTRTVDNVTVGMSGYVTATFLFQGGNKPWMTVCNVSQSSNGVTAEACRGILAVLTTAQVAQKKVQMWFDNATPGNCSYSACWAPLTTMGYYYGPALMN